jgi:hypothetical protein
MKVSSEDSRKFLNEVDFIKVNQRGNRRGDAADA